MDELILKTFIVGSLYNNCYLIYDKDSREGFIVDAPAPSKDIVAFIEEKNIKINFIALTHAHFDHISDLSQFSAPFYIHRGDVPLLRDPGLNGSVFFGLPIRVDREPHFYEEGMSLDFCGHFVKVIHTPGHSPGSVSLQLGNWLFSGDTIFFNAVGRTDIPLAVPDVLTKSINEKILTLPSDTIIYPGHGPSTSVGREIKAKLLS